MLPDYTLQLAEHRVTSYREKHDALMEAHTEAMECRQCEGFLQLGIVACRWIRRADETLREAAKEGLTVLPEAVDTLRALYRAWCKPCQDAEQLIREQKSRGYDVANEKEFREAKAYVERQVRKLDAHATLGEAFSGGVFDGSFWQEAHRIRSS